MYPNRIYLKTKNRKENMITLGDVVLVGYGYGKFQNLDLLELCLTIQVGLNNKFRIRFIWSN